ncbi:MAG: hypothetical protein MUE44_28590 [Oscillatoriaceae cyanobacterium Prado104]|nr:hypothetical protein [Oscillatoriaceae cyanobacterium Prado104]
MTQEFARDEQVAVGNIHKSDGSKNRSEQHIVRVMVSGSPEAVRETIFTLYRLGFAAADDWSPAQPGANPKEVISVLIRRKSAGQEKQQAAQPNISHNSQ